MDAQELGLARTRAAAVDEADRTLDATARTGAMPTPAAPGVRLQAARLGRYAILRTLGEGGMGIVYAAYDEELDRKIALKLLHAERSGGTEGRSRLLREAQALARLSHPNVVQIHEIGEHEGQVFVAMEYIEGLTLQAWQRDRARPLAAVLGAYRQAGEGLLAAHRAGLVHRDFKPENALVGVDGRVRVVDFGLARRGLAAPGEPREACDKAPDADAAMTLQGMLVGTPAYMSPEQFEGRPADARSDIFSFSVALWEAVHGERPFAGRTVHEIAASVVSGARRAAVVDVPARLRHALERGLTSDPDARWPTLEPLLAALAVDPSADPSGSSRQRLIFSLVLGGMGLIILVVLASSLLLGGEQMFAARIQAIGWIGISVVAGLVLAFRRTLLRNLYHRKLVLIIFGLITITVSQRLFGHLHGAPLVVVILDTMHLVAGMTLVAALCFARWMGLLTVYASVGILLGFVRPDLYPGAMLLFAPLSLGTVGYFWRRDAGRGAA